MFAVGFALAGFNVAKAESVMKECGADWQAAKAAGTTNGQTWQEFLKSCRLQHQGGAQAVGWHLIMRMHIPTFQSLTRAANLRMGT